MDLLLRSCDQREEFGGGDSSSVGGWVMVVAIQTSVSLIENEGEELYIEYRTLLSFTGKGTKR